jgi:hypothetical protein
LNLNHLLRNEEKRKYLDKLERQGVLPTIADTLSEKVDFKTGDTSNTTPLSNKGRTEQKYVRHHLIRREDVLEISSTGTRHRASDIWNELKFELKFGPHNNAIAVLFRVLLSRSPKVLQQLSEPEAFGHHASLAARLLRRQPQNPISGLGGQSIDGRGLSVGRDQPLELAPELIHWAQFGRLPGQPHEPDAQPVGQGLGLRGGVGAGPVGEQPEPAGAAVAAPQRAQERLSIGLTGTGADQRHPASAAQVNRPKQHPLGVAPGDRHEGLRALERPGRPQRRKQPQQRPVEAQQPITPVPAGLQASGDPPFFCDR